MSRFSQESPELKAGFDFLSSGQWVPGPSLLQEMSRFVPPGPALRLGQSMAKDPETRTRDELIASGRRKKVLTRLSKQLEKGRWETDPPKLTSEHHYAGATWMVRDKIPGAIPLIDVVKQLGTDSDRLIRWGQQGLVPPTIRLTATSMHYVTPDMVDIYRQALEMAPEPGKKSWKGDPRILWQGKDARAEQSCPHCGESLKLTVAVMKGESHVIQGR